MTKIKELVLDGLKLFGFRSDNCMPHNGGVCILRSN